MGTCQTHHLSPLSEDDNWSLFKHHAFGPNTEGRAELVAIGEEIVRKFAGSPLASKVLGSLLCNKNEEKQWLSVKESSFWDIPQGDAIMRALRISYFNLNISLRRCFSFGVIYPEDFKISKEDLIHLWIANGFIQPRRNLVVEEVGSEAWAELWQRSFFQEVKTDSLGNTSFKIHDLFHELAQSIMGKECKAFHSEILNNLSSRVHHISCSGFHNKRLNIGTHVPKKLESLRTFIELYPSYHSYGLKAFNSLQALCTHSSQLSGLESLTHLRYLNIYSSNITSLPKCVSRLQKLQVLKLDNCVHLSRLPKNLTQLKDLRRLLIRRCWSLVEMPPNIGELKSLKTLEIFILGSNRWSSLEELQDLKLGGRLHIKGLENVHSVTDARSANLSSEKELNQLYLSWDCNSISACASSEGILEALEPYSNLKIFGMKGYRGGQFPNWLINTSILLDLVCIKLHDCINCEQLPPLGKLPHLTTLLVFGVIHVKYIDNDSYNGMEEKAFKSLKKLTLSGLPNLERMLRDETVVILPLLSDLNISCVPKLRLPILPSIEDLQIEGLNSDPDNDMASFLEAIGQSIPHVKTLRIWQFPELKVLPDELGSFSSLQRLEIFHCHELDSLKENVLQGMSSLKVLTIERCKKLKSLSEGVSHLKCLESLQITGCPELVTLPNNMNQLTTLRNVIIYESLTLPE